MAAPLFADQIVTPRENLQRVRVIGLQDGSLLYRGSDGGDGSVDLAIVDRILVQNANDLRDLNEAEEYLAKGLPQEALVRYERASRLARDFWPTVIRIRMLRAAQRAENVERTVEIYTDLVESGLLTTESAGRFFPWPLKVSDPKDAQKSLERLNLALAKAGGDDVREILSLLRFAVMDATNPAEVITSAKDVAAMPLDAALSSKPIYELKRSALARLQLAGDHQGVLTSVRRILEDCPPELLPDFLMLKADALQAIAASRDDWLKTASTYLRLPIHFPEHPAAPKALINAAAIHERLERPREAITLLRECLGTKSLSDADRQDAQSRLDRLLNDG